MAALHLDQKGRVHADNEIASEYAKNPGYINEQIKKGNLLYDGNKKGSVNGLQGNGLQLPERDDPLDPMVGLQQSNVPVKDFEKNAAIDNRLKELSEEIDKEKAKAKKAVAHKQNAVKAGRDQSHIDDLQRQADEADARQDELLNEYKKLQDEKRKGTA